MGVETQENHWEYSVNEWEQVDYFKTVTSILKQENIKNFIDIGANVGGVSFVLLKNIPSIETGYLFEPQKDNFNYLFNKLKNLDKFIFLNCGIHYGKKYQNAIKPTFSHVGAYTLIDNSYSNFIESDEPFHLFELEFFNFKPIDFVKMDIEGGEYNIIENSTFLQTVKYIDIELHRDYDENYIQKYFPNHHIIWYSKYWNNNIGDYDVNHVFLKKNN